MATDFGFGPLARGRLRETLRTSLWFIPAVCVVTAILLALGTGWIDDRLKARLAGVLFSSNPESARSFLTTVSGAMITFTGLVFSITIVVLQLASAQFSPRVLRTFLRDRLSQLSLGIFVATFTYSLVVLREVRTSGEVGDLPAHVPQVSTATAFGLVLVSIGFFVAYINHIAQSIRVSHIIESIGAETRELLLDIFDHAHVGPPATEEHPRGEPDQTVTTTTAGVVRAFDRDALVEVAAEAGVVIKIVPGVGEFVPRGDRVYEVYGGEVVPDRLLDLVDLGTERTMQQDPAFGFRQLVDIAEKALSPAINDPTTAVQSLDQMHDLLRHMAPLPFPTGERRDSSGTLRVLYPVVQWDEYVRLALDEIRHFGAKSIQVMRRVRSLILDLQSVAAHDRQDILRQELVLFDGAIERHFPDREDRATASKPDRRGLA